MYWSLCLMPYQPPWVIKCRYDSCRRKTFVQFNSQIWKWTKYLARGSNLITKILKSRNLATTLLLLSPRIDLNRADMTTTGHSWLESYAYDWTPHPLERENWSLRSGCSLVLHQYFLGGIDLTSMEILSSANIVLYFYEAEESYPLIHQARNLAQFSFIIFSSLFILLYPVKKYSLTRL